VWSNGNNGRRSGVGVSGVRVGVLERRGEADVVGLKVEEEVEEDRRPELARNDLNRRLTGAGGLAGEADEAEGRRVEIVEVEAGE